MSKKRDYTGMTDQQIQDRAVDDMRCAQRAQAWGLDDQAAQFSGLVDEGIKVLNGRSDDRLRAEGWDV